MKAYDNYIFDLYGTLVDIHTEENDPLVWKKLALFYGYYDADYSSEELKERYAAIIAGEEYKMKSEKKDDAHEAHPEVQIEEVFQKLFEEKGVKADPTLAVHAGQFFRILSTDYVKLYDGVIDLLEALKKKGKTDIPPSLHVHIKNSIPLKLTRTILSRFVPSNSAMRQTASISA